MTTDQKKLDGLIAATKGLKLLYCKHCRIVPMGLYAPDYCTASTVHYWLPVRSAAQLAKLNPTH